MTLNHSVFSADNALCMAEDTIGPEDREVKALDLEKLTRIVNKHAYAGLE